MEIPKSPKEDRQIFLDRNNIPICSLPNGVVTTPNSPWYARLVSLLILGNYADNLISIGSKFIKIHKEVDQTQVAIITEAINNKIRELKIHEYVGVKDPASLKKKYELYAQLENYLEQLRTKYQS